MTDKKIENILFYAASSIKPSKKGLENILENLPVTNLDSMRYNYRMGWKLALPFLALGAILLLIFALNKTSELPATVTSGNVDQSLGQVDSSVSQSVNQMDQDLQTLDRETSSDDSDLNSL